MVDLSLFNDTSSAPVTRFGGPFDDNDMTKGVYHLLSAAPGIIFYSQAPAEQLLTTLDGIFPDLNFKSSRHSDSGCLNTDMTGELAGELLYWSLFEGPQGSAMMCIAAGGEATKLLRVECLHETLIWSKRHPDFAIVNALFDNGVATVGAAAAIGMGSVVAPWYVPGFERTHEPTTHNDSAKDGYDLGLMSPELVRALASWRQVGYDMYQKPYNAEGFGDVNLFATAGVEHDGPGPKLLFPLDTMTEQELTATWSGVERFGPCRPYLFSGIGTVMCDLDPQATAEQVDERARELLDTVHRWLHRNDGGNNDATSASPVSTASTSQSASSSDSHSRRLHDALKARLDATLGRSPASAATTPSASPAAAPVPMPSAPSAPSPAAAMPQTGRRFCTSCGAQLPPNAKFCGQCGTKVR